MLDLLELSEREDDLVPEILPVDARLSLSALSHTLISLFASAVDVASVKEILPHTSHAMIVAKDAENVVEVSATDGERAITLTAPAIVRMSGTALLPAKRMLDILKLTEGTVRIDVVGTTATIRAGRAVWTVHTPPVGTSLPNLDVGSDLRWVSASKAELLRALELTLPAVSRTTARQSLMQAEVAKGHITACDGVRAHRMSIPSLDKNFKTTFPLKFIETAIKELRATSQESIHLWSDHSTVALALGDNRLYSQRLNFEFPAVNHLVLGPALQNEERLITDVNDLVSAIKRVRVNADPEYSAIFLSVRQAKSEWIILVQARDKSGNASQEIVSATYTGPVTHKDLAVNHRYLLDFLACTEGPELTLRLGESTKMKQAPIYYESDSFVGSLMTMAPNFVR